MAVSNLNAVRVRVYFDYPPPALSDCRMCWVLVDLNKCRVVADIASILRDKFDFSRRTILNLFIEDCYLPPTESVYVVRDNDSIRVKVERTSQVNGCESTSDVETHRLKGKKRRRDVEEESEEIKEVARSKRKKKKEGGIQEVEPIHPVEEVKKNKDKKKRRKKKEKRPTAQVKEPTPSKSKEGTSSKKLAPTTCLNSKTSSKRHSTSSETSDSSEDAAPKKPNTVRNQSKLSKDSLAKTAAAAPVVLAASSSSDSSSGPESTAGLAHTKTPLITQALPVAAAPAAVSAKKPQGKVEPSSSDSDSSSSAELVLKRPNLGLGLGLSVGALGSCATGWAGRGSRNPRGAGRGSSPGVGRGIGRGDVRFPWRGGGANARGGQGAVRGGAGNQSSQFTNQNGQRQQHLEETLTNKTCILQNPPESVPKRDYNTLPLLAAPPQVGQRIAFKLLELTENYTPEVSEYKEGKIIGFNQSNNQMELELLSFTRAPVEPGKFDLVYQNPDGLEVVEYAVPRGSRLTERWEFLLEPRLIVENM